MYRPWTDPLYYICILNRKRKNFAVEIFLLYLWAPLHRENIVREMSPCFSRASLATAA